MANNVGWETHAFLHALTYMCPHIVTFTTLTHCNSGAERDTMDRTQPGIGSLKTHTSELAP